MTDYPLGSTWKRGGSDSIYTLGRVRDLIPNSQKRKNAVAFIGPICWLSIVVENPDSITFEEFRALQGRSRFTRIKEIKKCLAWIK